MPTTLNHLADLKSPTTMYKLLLGQWVQLVQTTA